MIVVPLLDDDNTPHKAKMVVEIDLNKLFAYLVENGKTHLSLKLRKNASGQIEPADPMAARTPRSAFEHTVNVFCNRYNEKLKGQSKAPKSKPASQYLQ